MKDIIDNKTTERKNKVKRLADKNRITWIHTQKTLDTTEHNSTDSFPL